MQHLIRPEGMPPTNGHSHVVTFTASSLVQVSGLVHPAFRIEIEAVAALPGG